MSYTKSRKGASWLNITNSWEASSTSTSVTTGQWQGSTYLAGRNHRKTTKTDSLSEAKEIAEDWNLGLRGKACAGLLKNGKDLSRSGQAFPD